MNIDGILEPVLRRLRLIVGRCTVVASKYVSGELEADAELVAGEKRRGLEFVQQFGFASRPKGNVDGVALFVGGSRDNGVVVATHGDCPEELKEGEAMIYTPFGSSLYLKDDGSIVATPASGKPFLVDGDVNVIGNVFSTKEVAAKCVSTPEGFVDVGAIHLSTHSHASAVGPTSPPTPGT